MKETFEITKKDISVLKKYALDYSNLKECSIREYSFGERILTEAISSNEILIVTKGKANRKMCTKWQKLNS